MCKLLTINHILELKMSLAATVPCINSELINERVFLSAPQSTKSPFELVTSK